jgi:thiamine transport system ATP-binding protein
MTLEIAHLCAGYRNNLVLNDFSLVVPTGHILGLLGPSGCGKSTLLRAITGLIPIQSGEILLDGRSLVGLPTHRRRIGMVFQNDQLFPHRDVAANIEFGLKMAKTPPEQRRQRRRELVDMVGLNGKDHQRVDELSGGEAKRVALARALAPAPDILLLDEPLTGLDSALHERLVIEVPEILRSLGTTAIWVTHNRDEAATVADELWEFGSPTTPATDSQGLRVVELSASETHDLRRAVLRVGTPTTEVDFAEDDDPSTWHLGIYSDSESRLLATSTWAQRNHRDFPDHTAIQLRGMAVVTNRQNSGLGSLLLTAGTAKARSHGAKILWARARDSALGFYLSAGWQVVGDGYIDTTTQLSHHDVLRDLRDDNPSPGSLP